MFIISHSYLTEKHTTVSVILKLFTSISTVALLIAICLYYHAGAEIKMLDARVDDPLGTWIINYWPLIKYSRMFYYRFQLC